MSRPTLPQDAQTSAPVAPKSADVAATGSQEIDALRQQVMQHEIHLADLAERSNRLAEEGAGALPGKRAELRKQMMSVNHEMVVESAQLRMLQSKIDQSKQEIETRTKEGIDARTKLLPPAPAVIATTQPPDSFLSPTQVVELAAGGMLLTLPLILALARRLWVRGSRVAHAPDLESSPRLQRMEQAIESIAVEVERIGEAQRFATKLLTERQAPAPISVAPFAGTTDCEP